MWWSPCKKSPQRQAEENLHITQPTVWRWWAVLDVISRHSYKYTSDGAVMATTQSKPQFYMSYAQINKFKLNMWQETGVINQSEKNTHVCYGKRTTQSYDLILLLWFWIDALCHSWWIHNDEISASCTEQYMRNTLHIIQVGMCRCYSGKQSWNLITNPPKLLLPRK